MAYTNSLGSKSIGSTVSSLNKLGQGLKQLKGFSPALGDIAQVRATTTVKPGWESNILGMASAVQGAVTAYGQAKQEADYKLAEEFYKTHSKEEINELAKNNKLDFQDNPLAMSRLRYLQGKDVLAIANLQFEERVNTNEFSGQSPEEVSAAYHQSLEEARGSMKEVWGASVDDSFFKQGFYETAGETQTKFLLKKATVESTYKTQEAIKLETNRLKSFISNPLITGDKFLDELTISQTINAPNLDVEQQSKLLGGLLEYAKGVPNGEDLLQDIADKELPGANGLTVREYLGDKKLQAYQTEASNLNDTLRANDNFQFREKYRAIASTGDFASIRSAIAEEYKNNGNVLTGRAKFLEGLLGDAERVQAAHLQAVQKDKDAKGWLLSACNGDNVAPYSTFGLTEKDLDRAYTELLSSGQISVNQLIGYATNPSQFAQKNNLARNFFAVKVNKALGVLEGSVDEALKQGSKDALTAEGISKIENDPDFSIVRDIIVNHPNQATQVFRGVSDKKLDFLFSYFNARETGVSAQECIGGIIRARTEEKKDKRSFNLTVSKTEKLAVKQLSGISKVEPDRIAQDSIQTSASNYRRMGYTPENAADMAILNFKKYNTVIKGSTFPNAFLVNPSNYNDNEKIITSFVGDALKTFNDTYKEQKGFKGLVEKDITVDYRHDSNTVQLYTVSGMLLADINKATFDARAQEFADKDKANLLKEALKRKKEDGNINKERREHQGSY